MNIYVLARLDAGSQAGVRGLASVPSVHTSPGKAQDSGDATTTPWAQLSRHTTSGVNLINGLGRQLWILFIGVDQV